MEMMVVGCSKNGTKVFLHPEGHPHRMDLAEESIAKMVIPNRPADTTDRSHTRIAATIDLWRKIGVNHLVKLRKNDVTVGYDRGRGYDSNIALFRHAKPETRITNVCMWDDENEKWVLWTNFEGDEGMPEPGCDRYNHLSEKTQEECRKFWHTHALVLDKEELEKLCKQLVDKYYDEREWLDSYMWGGMLSLEWNSRDAMLQSWYDRVISKIE